MSSKEKPEPKKGMIVRFAPCTRQFFCEEFLKKIGETTLAVNLVGEANKEGERFVTLDQDGKPFERDGKIQKFEWKYLEPVLVEEIPQQLVEEAA